MRKGWLIVIGLVVGIALPGEGGHILPVTTDTGNTQQRVISVSGQGRVTVTPDIAVLRLGVETQADTVSEAMSKAATAMEAVITSLKANGVEEKDIQTFHFSISQALEWDRVTNKHKMVGYRVSNMVSASIRALDQVGPIIDAVAKAGGDLVRIHGVSFAVEDPTPYNYEAREKAFADAEAKAEQLAGLAGVTLGRAIFISDGLVRFPPPIPMVPLMERAVAAPVEPTPIMPGEQEVAINVQVIFAIE